MDLLNHIKNGLVYANYTSTHVEPAEKLAKVIYRQIDAFHLILKGVSTPLLNLSGQLKDACSVFETVKIFGNIKMFIVPERNGKYLLTNPNNSWQKKLDRVTLLCHNAFKFVKGLNKFGFVQLGVLAKNAIGQLPIFSLAMDSFIVASSIFSTWDSVAFGLKGARRNAALADAKLAKWESLRARIEFLKAGDALWCRSFEIRYGVKALKLDNTLNDLNEKIKSNEARKADILAKIEACAVSGSDKSKEALEKELDGVAAVAKQLSAQLDSTEASKAKLAVRQALIDAKDWKGLAENLEASAERIVKIVNGTLKNDPEKNKMANVDFKIRKWEVCKANAKIETNKVWLRIANAVGKIAVVALAMVLTAANFWIVPAVIAVNEIGTVVDSIGWTKMLTDEFYKNKTLPKAVSAW